MSTRPQTLYGLADSPVDLAALMIDHGDGTGQPGLIAQVLDGTPAGRPHPRRHPRQHHALLADQHRRSRRPGSTGRTRPAFFDAKDDHHPVRHQRLPRRALPGAAELGRARLSRQPHPLQPGSTEAATSPPGSSPQLFSRGAARRVPVAALSAARVHMRDARCQADRGRRARRRLRRGRPAPTVRRSSCCTAGPTTSTASPTSRRCWRRRATG